MKRLRYIFYLLTIMLGMTACTDSLDEGGMEGAVNDVGVGEKVLFTVGATNNSVTTRADGDGNGDDKGGSGGQQDNYSETKGQTYYMGDGSRFVCRMYYKAQTGSELFDITDNTKMVSWLKVEGTVGNSLYWRNNYPTLDKNVSSNFDSYGNDAEATCFYWQNRKNHAFLAWTDLNKAQDITYGSGRQGNLKMDADMQYEEHTGKKQTQWVLCAFRIPGVDNMEFTSWKDCRTYLEGHYDDIHTKQTELGLHNLDYTGKSFYYEFGWSCRYSYGHATTTDDINTGDASLSRRYQSPVKYLMYFDKFDYDFTGTNITTDYTPYEDKDHNLYLKKGSDYVAHAEKVEAVTTNAVYYTGFNNNHEYYRFWQTDRYGNDLYDESNPKYTFFFERVYKQEETEVIDYYNCNWFDLKRYPEQQHITDQPDICQALTIQAPAGATQAANRVNLYFKHQFSQVQVNLKSSSDNSVSLERDDILKVELLGVSEKGYVFTELSADGKVHEATYEDVDVSKFDDEELRLNPYGTAFEMFDMKSSDSADDNYGYPVGYLKSFNGITFGQLQAIRITWKEHDSNIEHKVTKLVTDSRLKNLKSGYKYIWNIELRRGTLASIRTNIEDWRVPTEALNYTTNGTIVD